MNEWDQQKGQTIKHVVVLHSKAQQPPGHILQLCVSLSCEARLEFYEAVFLSKLQDSYLLHLG